MKTFEGLFAELKAKAKAGDPASGTVKELAKGTHFIGKKSSKRLAKSGSPLNMKDRIVPLKKFLSCFITFR